LILLVESDAWKRTISDPSVIVNIRELKTVPTETYEPGNFNLQTIDVRWSNLCNLACVYCSPEFSSKWADELQVKINQPGQAQLENFQNYIYQNINQLKHVYLAGGEPLLMKENLQLLQLLEKSNPDIQIRVNTNLSKVDTKIFETICRFPNVHWTISIETIEDQFEYIRHGGKWKDFLENLQTIQGLSHRLNHKITFNMLWLLLNYDSIFDCVDYLKNLGFHNNSFVIGALLTPEYLNIRHLPNSVLYSLKSKLKEKIAQQPGYLLEDSYKNMLHYIQIPFEQHLENSFEQLTKLDQRRNLDSSKIFKNLYKLKED
jgi:sulfatase maturation enzyme AslB (radical SAM superfamily)